MNVLIIDDSEDKVSALRAEVLDWQPEANILVARSFQGAMKMLTSTSSKLHVILLDMTLPTHDNPDGSCGGRNRLYGGRELLAEMDFEGVQTTVILCTQFDTFPGPDGPTSLQDLVGILRREYPGLLCGGIYFSHVDSSWRAQLRRMLNSMKIP